MIEATCIACGKRTKVQPSRLRKSKHFYCSHLCGTSPCIPKKCVVCNADYLARPRSASISKYCSTQCKHKKNRQKHNSGQYPKVKKTCENCNTNYHVRKSYAKTQKYCSQKCSADAIMGKRVGKNNHKWKPKVKIKCKGCNKSFETYPSRGSRKVYCSKKCSKIKVESTCKNCGKSEYLQPSRAKKKSYCSLECALEYTNKNKPERTSIELSVYNMLKSMRYKFIEQYSIGRFFCDFFVCNHNLIIEADGDYWHSLEGNIKRDKRKNKLLKSKGYKLLRLTETDINTRPEWCKNKIKQAIKAKYTQASLF